MDVHCTTCGEPWDTFHLRQEAIHETGLPETEITHWKLQTPEDKLSKFYRHEFKLAGYEFGQTLTNLTRCPACPSDAKPEPEKLYLKAELENILHGDEDGLAAHYDELGL